MMSNILSQRWLLNRRHFLRGVGAMIPLPLLDAMHSLRASPSAVGKNGIGSGWHPSVKTHELMAAMWVESLKKDLGW
jgi:hypothetical protein